MKKSVVDVDRFYSNGAVENVTYVIVDVALFYRMNQLKS